MTDRHYLITLKHDKGETKLQTNANSKSSAINKITLAEDCPQGAVTSVKDITNEVRMRQALSAIAEAGRMSYSRRSRYMADIARNALDQTK